MVDTRRQAMCRPLPGYPSLGQQLLVETVDIADPEQLMEGQCLLEVDGAEAPPPF